MAQAEVLSGAACTPNISAAGRRRRRRGGWLGIGIAVVMLAAFAVFHVAWYWRTLVFLPISVASFGFLQASRNTCVARAREGTFEHEDMSTTKAPDADVAASRKVARTITRDGVLIALAAAALAAATAWIA